MDSSENTFGLIASRNAPTINHSGLQSSDVTNDRQPHIISSMASQAIQEEIVTSEYGINRGTNGELTRSQNNGQQSSNHRESSKFEMDIVATTNSVLNPPTSEKGSKHGK